MHAYVSLASQSLNGLIRTIQCHSQIEKPTFLARAWTWNQALGVAGRGTLVTPFSSLSSSVLWSSGCGSEVAEVRWLVITTILILRLLTSEMALQQTSSPFHPAFSITDARLQCPGLPLLSARPSLESGRAVGSRLEVPKKTSSRERGRREGESGGFASEKTALCQARAPVAAVGARLGVQVA